MTEKILVIEIGKKKMYRCPLCAKIFDTFDECKNHNHKSSDLI